MNTVSLDRAFYRTLDAATYRALGAQVPPHFRSVVKAPALLTPALAATLKFHGVRPVLGLHDRMPVAEAQLPVLRATWPGDLVCRWNLQRGERYAEARDAWAPCNPLQAEDPATRATLVKVVVATLQAGRAAFITINNKAKGCAPASVLALARAIDESN